MYESGRLSRAISSEDWIVSILPDCYIFMDFIVHEDAMALFDDMLCDRRVPSEDAEYILNGFYVLNHFPAFLDDDLEVFPGCEYVLRISRVLFKVFGIICGYFHFRVAEYLVA